MKFGFAPRLRWAEIERGMQEDRARQSRVLRMERLPMACCTQREHACARGRQQCHMLSGYARRLQEHSHVTVRDLFQTALEVGQETRAQKIRAPHLNAKRADLAGEIGVIAGSRNSGRQPEKNRIARCGFDFNRDVNLVRQAQLTHFGRFGAGQPEDQNRDRPGAHISLHEFTPVWRTKTSATTRLFQHYCYGQQCARPLRSRNADPAYIPAARFDHGHILTVDTRSCR